MDNQFVVYGHYINNQLFYIGEGRLKRAYCKNSRNAYWNNKVNKHKNYEVVIFKSNLTKEEALNLERLLIEIYKEECNLTNLCIGSFTSSHWLINLKDKDHPFYTKLIARNKQSTKKVHCIELGITYSSLKEAVRCNHPNPNSTILVDHLKGRKKRAFGYTWRYVI